LTNKEEISADVANQRKIQQRESFGSKAPPSRTMGQIEHSAGHKEEKEQKYVKESHDQVKGRHRLTILPPLSKLKIGGNQTKD
jgi:hypothetical protein